MSKILVAYFSASGVTAKAAKKLAKAEEADIFEIKPKISYTAADLDWTNKKSRSTLEMSDPACRPEIVGRVDNMDKYGTIFVGFPIWWGREPSVVDTFLDSYDFTGRKIVPFCTSGGSGIEKATEHIREIVGDGVAYDIGKRLGGEITENDLKIWTEGLSL